MRDITIEYPSIGTTYCREEYGVYEYSTYPSYSVLAGQQKRVWLDGFPTLEEAQAAYPEAVATEGCGFTPPDLSGLPFDPDYDE